MIGFVIGSIVITIAMSAFIVAVDMVPKLTDILIEEYKIKRCLDPVQRRNNEDGEKR